MMKTTKRFNGMYSIIHRYTLETATHLQKLLAKKGLFIIN